MKNKILLAVLPFLGYLAIRLFGFTWRIKVSNPSGSPTPDANKNSKIIFAFWHNRLIAHTYRYRHCDITALISQSRDGEYIARLAGMLGHNAVRGSTTRNGRTAMAEMIELLEHGRNVTITPDGPQGPLYHLQPGVVEMARASGASIVPMSYDASKKYVFNSWDGFILPMPFAHIIICFGSPISIPKILSEEEFEGYRRKVEKSLVEITQCAEALTQNSGSSK